MTLEKDQNAFRLRPSLYLYSAMTCMPFLKNQAKQWGVVAMYRHSCNLKNVFLHNVISLYWFFSTALLKSVLQCVLNTIKLFEGNKSQKETLQTWWILSKQQRKMVFVPLWCRVISGGSASQDNRWVHVYLTVLEVAGTPSGRSAFHQDKTIRLFQCLDKRL